MPLPAPGWSYNDMLHDAQVLTQKNGNTVTRSGLWSPPDDPFSLSDYSVSAGGAPFENSILTPPLSPPVLSLFKARSYLPMRCSRSM